MLKINGLCSFETSGTYYPVKRRHIPEERSPKTHLCENLQTRYLWYILKAFGYISQPAIWGTGQLCAALWRSEVGKFVTFVK
jgi:hypothetical protein